MFIAVSKTIPGTIYRLPRNEVATAFYQLSRFLSVGISLDDALEDISKGTVKRHGRRVWSGVGHAVASGQNLSEAIASGIRVESTIIAIIRSGETNGQLDEACEAVSEYLRWNIALRQRILTILVYPLFSLCVLGAVTGFLLVSVVPSIEGFLLSTGETLEWHTHALLGVSSWVSQYFFVAMYLSAGFVLCVVILVAISPGMRRFVDHCVLRLPLLGRVLVDLLLSRYARCCAQLYDSGIALETSLQLAEQTIQNRALRTELAGARIRMLGGATLADALGNVPALPPIFTRLVAVGERSGQLSAALFQLGEQQSNAADASINRIEQLTGPVILLCIGSVLLWIVVSMLGPVYNMAIATVVGAS